MPFLAAGGHADKCPGVVGKAAKWAAEIYSRTRGKRGIIKSREYLSPLNNKGMVSFVKRVRTKTPTSCSPRIEQVNCTGPNQPLSRNVPYTYKLGLVLGDDNISHFLDAQCTIKSFHCICMDAWSDYPVL